MSLDTDPADLMDLMFQGKQSGQKDKKSTRSSHQKAAGTTQAGPDPELPQEQLAMPGLLEPAEPEPQASTGPEKSTNDAPVTSEGRRAPTYNNTATDPDSPDAITPEPEPAPKASTQTSNAGQIPQLTSPNAGYALDQMPGWDGELMRACYDGDAETARSALQQGADPVVVDDQGRTPLRSVLEHGKDVDVFCELVAFDALEKSGYVENDGDYRGAFQDEVEDIAQRIAGFSVSEDEARCLADIAMEPLSKKSGYADLMYFLDEVCGENSTGTYRRNRQLACFVYGFEHSIPEPSKSPKDKKKVNPPKRYHWYPKISLDSEHARQQVTDPERMLWWLGWTGCRPKPVGGIECKRRCSEVKWPPSPTDPTDPVRVWFPNASAEFLHARGYEIDVPENAVDGISDQDLDEYGNDDVKAYNNSSRRFRW